MNRQLLGIVLATLAIGGCMSRGEVKADEATAETRPAEAPQEERRPLAERVADRVAGGLIGAGLGALIGLGAAASIANGDPNGTMYVSYVTVPLFALAGVGTGLSNGVANTAPAMLQGMPFPMARTGFHGRGVRFRR